MTYIKLESIIDEIWAYIEDWYEDEVRRLLNCSSASIDFEEMIQEMIKEYEWIDWIYHEVTDTLKELLNKLPK